MEPSVIVPARYWSMVTGVVIHFGPVSVVQQWWSTSEATNVPVRGALTKIIFRFTYTSCLLDVKFYWCQIFYRQSQENIQNKRCSNSRIIIWCQGLNCFDEHISGFSVLYYIWPVLFLETFCLRERFLRTKLYFDIINIKNVIRDTRDCMFMHRIFGLDLVRGFFRLISWPGPFILFVELF